MPLKISFLPIFILLFFTADAQQKETGILQGKIDSLQNELDSCQMSLMFQSKFPIELKQIKGKFISISQGDCFHILFRDSEGTEWDFGSANNSIPYELWEYDDETNKFSLAKKIIGKEFSLVLADLYAIRCNSAESYDAGNRHYIKMPTIIEMYEIRK